VNKIFYFFQRILYVKVLFNFKLLGYGWSSLINIDPNVENYCGAGIIHTSTQQYGCLYRFEPNKQAQVI
jgi:hypothetical protein